MEAKLTRRGLLKTTALAAFGTLLAACGAPTAAPTPTTAAAQLAAPTQAANPATAPTATMAPATGTEPVTITYGEWEITDLQLQCHKDVIKAFMADNPKVKVDFQEVQVDKVKTQLAAGTAADVVHPDDDTVIAGVASLTNLDPYIKQEKEVMANHLMPSAIDFYRIEGKVTAWGRALDAGPLVFFNKNIFDEVKVPYPTDFMSWDDYHDVVLKSTKREGNRITVWGTRDSVQFIDSMAATNGLTNGAWSLDGKTLLMGDPAYREAANYLFNFIVKDKVAASDAEFKELGGHWQMFATAKLATSLSYAWVLAPFKAITAFKWDAAKVPIKKEKAAFIEEYGLSIPAAAKNKDAGWQFLAYYGTKAGSEIVLKYEYGVPLFKGLLPDIKGPLGKVAQMGAENGRLISKKYPHTQEFLNKEVNPRWDLVKIGKTTADKAIDELITDWPKYVPAR